MGERALAGFIRNKVRAGQTATFVLSGRRVHVIPHTVLGQELPGMLVASDRGESLWVDPATPLNTALFMAGGFSTGRASALVRLFKQLAERHSLPTEA